MRKIGISVLILAFVFGATPVMAQTDETTALTTEDDVSAEREARIVERKADLEDRLDEKRESILVRKCGGAQARLSSLAQRVQVVSAKRLRAYNGFGEKFDGFLEKLAEADIDTTDLEATLALYTVKTVALSESFNQYEVAIEDMSNMNCSEDPEGFEATLRQSRQLALGLKDEIQALHAYLRGEIREAFTQVMNAYRNTNANDSTEDADAAETTDLTVETEVN